MVKALLATLLLACGLNKASAAIDPTAHKPTNEQFQTHTTAPCVTQTPQNIQ